MEYTLTKNADFGSIEITFDGKPAQAIRNVLKTLRFRWHGVRRVWYGYADEQTTRAALAGVNVSGTVPAANVQNSKQNRKPAEQRERVRVCTAQRRGADRVHAERKTEGANDPHQRPRCVRYLSWHSSRRSEQH